MKYCPYCRKRVKVRSFPNIKALFILWMGTLPFGILYIELKNYVQLSFGQMLVILVILVGISTLPNAFLIAKLSLKMYVVKCSVCKNDLSSLSDPFQFNLKFPCWDCFPKGTERLIGEYRKHQSDEYDSIESQIEELNGKKKTIKS